MVSLWLKNGRFICWIVLGCIFNQCGTLFNEEAQGNCKLGTERGEELHPFPASVNIHSTVKMCPMISLTKTATSLWFGGQTTYYKRKHAGGRVGRTESITIPLSVGRGHSPAIHMLKSPQTFQGLVWNDKWANCFPQSSWSKTHSQQNSTLKAAAQKKKKILDFKTPVSTTNIHYTGQRQRPRMPSGNLTAPNVSRNAIIGS